MNYDVNGLDTTLPQFAAQSLTELMAEDEVLPSREARKKFAKEIERRAATFVTTTTAASVSFLDAKGITSAAAAIQRMPAPNEYIHGVTYEDFTVFDIIPAVLKLTGAPRIDSLTFTTLGFGYNNLQTLDSLINARTLDPKNLRIMASGFFKAQEDEMWRMAERHAKSYGYALTTTRNHTKIILLAIGTDRYVIESSSNMRSCRAIEQFTMTNNAKLFAFHHEWIDYFWDKHE